MNAVCERIFFGGVERKTGKKKENFSDLNQLVCFGVGQCRFGGELNAKFSVTNSSFRSASVLFYNSSLILRSFVTSSASASASSCGTKVTSLVSDWTVSRLERLCVAMADGSGEVSVIREP